jgi:hypothetical protein
MVPVAVPPPQLCTAVPLGVVELQPETAMEMNRMVAPIRIMPTLRN